MNNKLTITESPHIFDKVDTSRMMYEVSLALIPAVIASIVFFRTKAAVLILVCIASCVLTEVFLRALRGRKVSAGDGSALLTGLLLAMIVPPGLPAWMAALSGVFAIGIGKEIFGGLGQNIFNPALLGRAFLAAAFPKSMLIYFAPAIGGAANVDAVSGATPLGLMKFSGVETGLKDLFFGNISGSLGETSALLLLIGGVYILARKHADWRLPVSFIGCVYVFGESLHLLSPEKYPSGLFHILAGGMMIGAFFMATDPVTSPATKSGKWVFGIGCGLLAIVIRSWGGQPEGVMYSILLMNSLTPIINRVTRPRRYGA